MEQTILSLIIIVACLFILFNRKREQVKQLKEEIKRIERSRDRWEDYYRQRIQRLESENGRLWKFRISNSSVSDDTVQAVKYAMKKSHPDNGGNAEDFMRFQKVYEELTRKRGRK